MLFTTPRQGLFALLLLLAFVAVLPRAQAAPTTPTADFTDNGDGTITHKTTGLTWKRCAEGQTWTGSTCSGATKTYAWAQATALTSTFAGKSDWRLPTIRELFTIEEIEAADPVVNSTIFPGFPAWIYDGGYSGYYWSATVNAANSGEAWSVNFGGGGADVYAKALFQSVRLVRGGQPVGLLALSRPASDYTDNGDGTVTHTPTALTWKRCAEGQAWTGSACSGTATAYDRAAATALTSAFAGKSDWRLPTAAELHSLVDFTRANPAINSTIFPNTAASGFWSASSVFRNSASSWMTDFGYGYISSYYHASYAHFTMAVRLVRSGQPAGALPAISSVSPASATLDQLTTFTVSGQNLTSGMGFTVGDCEYSNAEVGIGSATQRTFQCTPRGTAGAKAGLVKTAPGGATLYNFSVNVTSPAASQTTDASCLATLKNGMLTIPYGVLFDSKKNEHIKFSASLLVSEDQDSAGSYLEKLVSAKSLDKDAFPDCNVAAFVADSSFLVVPIASNTWGVLHWRSDLSVNGETWFDVVDVLDSSAASDAQGVNIKKKPAPAKKTAIKSKTGEQNGSNEKPMDYSSNGQNQFAQNEFAAWPAVAAVTVACGGGMLASVTASLYDTYFETVIPDWRDMQFPYAKFRGYTDYTASDFKKWMEDGSLGCLKALAPLYGIPGIKYVAKAAAPILSKTILDAADKWPMFSALVSKAVSKMSKQDGVWYKISTSRTELKYMAKEFYTKLGLGTAWLASKDLWAYATADSPSTPAPVTNPISGPGSTR